MSYSNFVQARVVAPVAATAKTLSLYAAEAPYQLPALDGGLLVLTDSPYKPSVIEVISYTSRSAQDLLGVVRGLEGTTAVEWSGNVYCYQSLMAGDFQSQLGLKAPLASPTFTGNPTAPTPAAEDADTSIATTAFVRAAMALFGLGGYSKNPGAFDANAITANGLYYSSTWTNGWRGYGHLTHIAVDSTYVVQVFYGATETAMAFRVNSGGTWSAWQELWHTGNLVKQTSPTDTTAGALMGVGAFGLGSRHVVTDADSAPMGLSIVNLSTAANVPAGMAGAGWLETDSELSFTGSKVQRLQTSDGSRSFLRTIGATAWRELFHTGNVLGTVSQSSGVPTGAIIERGSNANGEYVRYADGTQLCWENKGATIGGGTTAGITFDNAAAFVGVVRSFQTYTASAFTLELKAGMEGHSSSGATVYVQNSSGASRDISVFFLSIGRWY